MRSLLILFATAASLLLGACGSNVEESAGTPVSLVEESAGTPVGESTETSISRDRLAYRIEAGSPPLILDIRSREDYARSHIPGAINIPVDELPTRMAELPIAKSDEVVVVQQLPWDPGEKLAKETLRESGYSDVRHLTGQLRKWNAAKLPTE